jgi:hypothetical protein
MKKSLIQILSTSGKVANQKIAQRSPGQKAQLEENWDIEHAYYSSALEGSKLDRKEFERLAKEIKE